jgi:SAM-dependent methyltransferase
MPDNTAMARYWNEVAGPRWVQRQAIQEARNVEMLEQLLAASRPVPGERVLDIGCGGGQTSNSLADAVGAAGHVTGVDISTPLLGLARSRARGNTDFIHADAAFHPFKPEYDLIFSRFGVMFFDDPAEAFTNIHRAAKPGARLAFVCWRPVPENEWVMVPAQAAQPFLPPPASPPDPLAPGPFAFADSKRVEAILTKAGFRNVTMQKLDGRMHLGSSSENAAFQMTNIGPLSRVLNEVEDEAVKDKVRAAVKRAFEAIRKDGEVAPAIACWLVSASA